MELWLKTSRLFNFADDTTTEIKGKCKLEIKAKLEEDAANILNFMASNGLVANKTKTEFLVLKERQRQDKGLKTELQRGCCQTLESGSSQYHNRHNSRQSKVCNFVMG